MCLKHLKLVTGENDNRVQDPVGTQPLAMREAPRPHHDGHQKGREGVRQRDGVVGRWFGEGQMFLHLPRKPDLPQEGNKTDQPAEGRDRLGRFIQNHLGFAKKRGNFRAGRFVQGRLGLFKHQSLCHQPFPQCDLFSTSGIGST